MFRFDFMTNNGIDLIITPCNAITSKIISNFERTRLSVCNTAGL